MHSTHLQSNWSAKKTFIFRANDKLNTVLSTGFHNVSHINILLHTVVGIPVKPVHVRFFVQSQNGCYFSALLVCYMATTKTICQIELCLMVYSITERKQ